MGDDLDDERDAATWEAAAVMLHNQTQRLLASLRAARRDKRIPQEVVGLGKVLTIGARADMLRAVEASRWQRDAERWRADARRLRRAVWALAGVSVLSLVVAVWALVYCATSTAP